MKNSHINIKKTLFPLLLLLGFLCVQTAFTQDTDGDGVPDSRDIDDDNDGILDINERTAALSMSGFSYLGFYNGSDYYLSDIAVNWTTAANEATRISGASLVTINSDAENTYVRNAVNAVYNRLNYWIGLNDQATEGTFVWQNGEPFIYSNWLPREPNNLNNEDFVQVAPNGKWNDHRFSASFHFVIELSPPFVDSDNDGVVNSLDLDSDNDGIPDNIEAVATQNYQNYQTIDYNADVDDDGLLDIFDANNSDTSTTASVGLVPVDTDNDGSADFLDTDSDTDGINDVLESFNTPPANNGTTTTSAVGANGLASDAEATDDYMDVNGNAHDGSIFNLTDTDNDTNANGSNANSSNGIDLNYRDAKDQDNDGVPDYRDIDDDNDGILDINEGAATALPISGFTYLGRNNGSDYYLSNGETDWSSAANAAISANAFLVSINSASENTYVRNAVTAVSNGESYWIGLNDQAIEGTFVWQNGEPFNYNNWSSGEPNNFGNEDSVQVFSNGKWNDNRSSANFRYVIELSPPLVDSDNDGIVNTVDLDSDNDGIPDNIEAVATQNYRNYLPIVNNADADADGLLDVFDANNSDTSTIASVGLVPIDTDSDGTADFLDTDSDNDGINDQSESGLGAIGVVATGSNGLGSNVGGSTTFNVDDINGLAHDGVSSFLLLDSDSELNIDGSNASPTVKDFDYRDDVPVNTVPMPISVAIGKSSPETTLDVNGPTITLANLNGTLYTCNTNVEGAFGYHNGSLAVCDGSVWKPILLDINIKNAPGATNSIGVGINTKTPRTTLEVAGPTRSYIRNASGVLYRCDATVEGAMGYDTISNNLKVCVNLNGSSNYTWRALRLAGSNSGSGSENIVKGVSINTQTPKTTVDVNGAFRALGGTNHTCDGNMLGAIGYDAKSKSLKICVNDGGYVWKAIKF